MATRFAEPTKVEIVARLEKANPENAKKQLNYSTIEKRLINYLYIIEQLVHSLLS